ncbi:MAG: ribonucleotide-diphosphate reductase subunit beta [Thermoleophilaceae bacterium]
MSIASVTQTPLDNVSYEDLYRRWEHGQWGATEIDLSLDAEQWRTELSDFERRAAIWNYSLFFTGEDAVTDGLSPYIDAAPLEEQKYFLATQQADEARHAVFFHRFMREVAGVGGESIGGSLGAVEPNLNWGFRTVFGRLERMCAELRGDPSVPRLAAAVTLYHLVIEATLAQTGQRFIAGYLAERDLLPGFRAGLERVEADEQRHIGFGVKLLSDLRELDPGVPAAVSGLLREILPATVSVIIPPGWDERYLTVFGADFVDLAEAGIVSILTKLRAAGLPLEDLPGPPPFPVAGAPRARAERTKRLLRAGYIGEKNGSPSRAPEDVGLLFESIAAGLDAGAAAGPGTIQWQFSDAEPWHVVVAGGSARALPGRADSPRLTLRSTLEDVVDVLQRRRDPRALIARGRLRARGDLRWVWRSRRMFPL